MNGIAINGSPNRSGCTARYLKEIALPIVHLAPRPKRAVQHILAADLVLFATPVRWFNVSALMKELLEALPEAPDFCCEGKIAILLAVCNEDGAQLALNQMAAPLSHMGFQFPPYGLSHFINTNMADRSEDRWMIKEARFIREQIAQLRKVNESRCTT